MERTFVVNKRRSQGAARKVGWYGVPKSGGEIGWRGGCWLVYLPRQDCQRARSMSGAEIVKGLEGVGKREKSKNVSDAKELRSRRKNVALVEGKPETGSSRKPQEMCQATPAGREGRDLRTYLIRMERAQGGLGRGGGIN